MKIDTLNKAHTMNNKVFSINVKFNELTTLGNHELSETWICKNIKDVKKVLCRELDLQADRKGYPIEPDIEKLDDALKMYAGKAYIKAEGKRLKHHYKIYLKLLESIAMKPQSKNDLVIGHAKIDPSTTIQIIKK